MNPILSAIKKFFESKFNIYLVIALIIMGAFAFIFTSEPKISQDDGFSVIFFYLPACPHCTEQKPIFNELKEEMKDVNFYSYDASSKEGSALFYRLAAESGLDKSGLAVPTIFVEKHPLIGVHSKEQIKETIHECREKCIANGSHHVMSQEVKSSFKDFELPFIGRTDLTAFSIPVLAIVLGLIDGFNPCAMWVLVYLIGLLIGIKDRKKIWVIIGSFVLASGVLYFLFMTAWINLFLFIGYIRILTILIGLVALGGGIIHLKEYFTTKGDLACEVGDEQSHEKTMTKIRKIISQPLSIAIILSIIGLAFVVNSVEFVCSSAIPAVFTQILAISGLSTLQHYAYIGLYTLFFMLDDLVIFSMAAFAIGSSLGEKYAKYCRLLGGVILTILGIILVFAPHLLR
ncbi:MAG: thioredoxin family protein [Nanoarchaeota archaeon]|nr:thioredoxin family protein [Nanoarchaeota archaeon]MBU4284348.1 thioredoxin family protein [Nanoarchaeota archaeon]